MAEDTETAVVENTEGVVDTPRRKTKNITPDGQTATGSSELGGNEEDEFAEPVTNVENLGTAKPTRVSKDDDDDESTPKLFVQLTKALGYKSGDLLSHNEKTRVAVYSNGGKYQVSKNGKGLRHLAGPVPPADLKLNVTDARFRSIFSGSAAAINAPAAVVRTNPELQDERDLLEARIAEIDKTLDEE